MIGAGDWLPCDGDLVESALAYAAHGWAVFPLDGKVPLVEHGHRDASTDEVQIRSSWARWPRANIGYPVPAAHIVLDVDALKGGYPSLRGLERKHGPLPWTLRQSTGGGGEHWIYRTPGGVELRQGAGILGAGLDTRAAGRGYIVVAPSLHQSGRRYRWHTLVEPVQAPAWLVSALRAPVVAHPTPYVAPSTPAGLSRRERYAQAVLRGEARQVAESPEGGRNARLNRAWWRCAQLRDVLDRAHVEAQLTRAGIACGLGQREIRAVLR